MDEIKSEQEWISKYDIANGRLKEDLTNEAFEWAKANPKRTKELEIELVKIELSKLYDEIIMFIDAWVDIPDNYKKIIAIWIIGTYFHKEFDTFPYLFINAMRGSGKTRLLKIISWLQKNGNGEVLTNPSDAVMFRTAKERGIILDEMESEKSKEKQTMREYLNACYKIGGIVYRMEKQKIDNKEKMVAVGHPLYTPIAMANINGIEDVLSDRSITLMLEKSMNPYLTKKIEDFQRNQTIHGLKTRLSIYSCIVCSVYPLKKGLEDWNHFIEARYNSTSIHTIHTIHNYTLTIHDLLNEEMFKKIDETGIYGRNLELFFPLMITAKMLNQDAFDEIIKIASGLNEKKREDEFNDSKDVSLIEFISLADRYRFEYVVSHDLFREFKDFIGNQGTDEESRWLNITWFGLALKRLQLTSDKKRMAKGQMILLNVDKAKEKLKLFKTEDTTEVKSDG